MSVANLTEELRSQLQSRVDMEFRGRMRTFFKEEIEPWGVRTADLQKITAAAAKTCCGWPFEQRASLSVELWESGMFEEGVLVCHLWRRFREPFSKREWDLFVGWIDCYVRNWAHCDGVASWLLSKCLLTEPSLQEQLPGWTQSTNRWKRRAAAVALLQEAKAGRSIDRILEIAVLLELDDDDMVRKGLGWLLKEAYPRRPNEVFAFVRDLRSSRVVIRYAAEKMTAAHRNALGLQ